MTFNNLTRGIERHTRLPFDFLSNGLAVGESPAWSCLRKSRSPAATLHLQTQAPAPALPGSGPLVLDHVVRAVERLATSLGREPTIYLIPGCATNEEPVDVLRKLCEEIFEEQLAGSYKDNSTWPQDRGYDVFCRWFDYQHHSMLVDLCDKPLIHD
jgi:hypothetical protein